jgi:hypothetical protein
LTGKLRRHVHRRRFNVKPERLLHVLKIDRRCYSLESTHAHVVPWPAAAPRSGHL